MQTTELLLAAPRVITAEQAQPVVEPGYVTVSAGLVTTVGQGPPPRAPDIALPDGLLVPGFVDLQVNGYYGTEFQDTDAAGWARVAARLPETGVTAFLPTFVTAPPGALASALRAAAELIPGLPGRAARVLGVHAEGPFIAPGYRGAHNVAWITDPSPAAVDELLDAGQGVLRLVTLAPERDGGLAAVARLADAGILVSVGHSGATAEIVANTAGTGHGWSLTCSTASARCTTGSRAWSGRR